jgi:hypothetical protein
MGKTVGCLTNHRIESHLAVLEAMGPAPLRGKGGCVLGMCGWVSKRRNVLEKRRACPISSCRDCLEGADGERSCTRCSCHLGLLRMADSEATDKVQAGRSRTGSVYWSPFYRTFIRYLPVSPFPPMNPV